MHVAQRDGGGSNGAVSYDRVDGGGGGNSGGARAARVVSMRAPSLSRKMSTRCSNLEDAPLLDIKSVSSLARADMSCTVSTWRGLPLHASKLGVELRLGYDTT